MRSTGATLLQANFRTLLNGTTPAITGDTSWPQVRRMLWQEPWYLAVPDVRRREIFNELREIMRDIEATQVPHPLFQFCLCSEIFQLVF